MKNSLRKYLSVERRDLWDGPREYLIAHLPTDKLKHMLMHRSKRDRRLKSEIDTILEYRYAHWRKKVRGVSYPANNQAEIESLK